MINHKIIVMPWLIIILFLVDYEFVHDGHCNGGYISSTSGVSLKGCRDHCAKLPKAGYFAYSTAGKKCACYSTAGGCPDDNQYPDYDSFGILRKGNFMLKYSFRIKYIKLIFICVYTCIQ